MLPQGSWYRLRMMFMTWSSPLKMTREIPSRETVPLTIDFTAPVITINEPLAADGYINQAEAQSGVTITGTGEADQAINADA